MQRLPTRSLWILLLLVPGLASAFEPPPRAGEVTLPLAEYLALMERVGTVERDAATAEEESRIRLTSQHTEVVIEGELARLDTVFEVEMRGNSRTSLPLPLLALAERASVEPETGAALDRSSEGELRLLAWRPGTYRVRVEGARRLMETGSRYVLPLAASTAPVATTTIELPAELAWSCEGAVAVSEAVEGDRRRLHLALQRDRPHRLELQRRLEATLAEEALVRSVVVTVVELGPEGPRRHEVVLFEVLRGELEAFTVTLPPGFQVDRLATDEGEAAALRRGDLLTVQRGQRVIGKGYLVLSDLSLAGGRVPLAPVTPLVEPRARYLVLAAGVAVEAVPVPASAWTQVDLEDLPEPLRQELGALRPTTAWRQVHEAAGQELALTTEMLPPAPSTGAVVTERETTTLMTPDGSLVHRERFSLRRVIPALEVELPPAARLWSVTVDSQAVRPLERGGRLAVPLAFRGGADTAVEVVAVEKRELPPGRSRLAIDLARVELPVLKHEWRLLLPEDHRYRWAEGTLPPSAQGLLPDEAGFGRRRPRIDLHTGNETAGPVGNSLIRGRVLSDDFPLPGAVVKLRSDRSGAWRRTVTDEAGDFVVLGLPADRYLLEVSLEGFDTHSRNLTLGTSQNLELAVALSLATVAEEIVVSATSRGSFESKRERERREEEGASRQIFLDQVGRLRQGLVGGVRPLPVELPESGKLLLLVGALPPPRVTAELEVRAGR